MSAFEYKCQEWSLIDMIRETRWKVSSWKVSLLQPLSWHSSHPAVMRNTLQTRPDLRKKVSEAQHCHHVTPSWDRGWAGGSHWDPKPRIITEARTSLHEIWSIRIKNNSFVSHTLSLSLSQVLLSTPSSPCPEYFSHCISSVSSEHLSTDTETFPFSIWSARSFSIVPEWLSVYQQVSFYL